MGRMRKMAMMIRAVIVIVIIVVGCYSDTLAVVHAIRITPSTTTSSSSHRSNTNTTSISIREENERLNANYRTIQAHKQQQHRRATSWNSSTTPRRIKVNVPTNPDDHLVTNLPLLDPILFPTRHWAGHLPANKVDGGDKYFFYWLFEPDFSEVSKNNNNDPNDPSVPLIVWLNGGPACSSMDGLFIENGPFRIVFDNGNNQYKIIPDKYSWHKLPAYTLYIDQPVGTGLSITSSHKYPTNDEEVNDDIYYFFQQFLKLHSDKFVDSNSKTPSVNRKLYFSGESYAGHYIPSFMNYLVKRNKGIEDEGYKDNIIIAVTGAAIGNGWTDPYYQYGAAEFAFVHGLIDREQMMSLLRKEKECQKSLNQGIYSVDTCFDLISNIEDSANGRNSGYTLLGYDIRKSRLSHVPRLFPPGHKVLESYLGGWPINTPHDPGSMSKNLYKDVLQSIHAEAMLSSGRQFTECTDPPYNALADNDGKGVIDDVVDVLDTGTVTLLFFNGMYDLICNHVGNELFLDKMNWTGTAKWRNADRYAWYAPSTITSNTTSSHSGTFNDDNHKVSGYMKEYKNLMFLKIKDAGHMVPLDLPDVAFDMMKTFITPGMTFRTNLQELEKTLDDSSTTCEVCPTCYERDSGRSSSTTSNPNGKNGGDGTGVSSSATPIGTFVISYAWLVAGIAVASLLIFLTVVRSQRRHRGSGEHIPIESSSSIIDNHQHQYDIELPDQPTPSYRDDAVRYDDYEDEPYCDNTERNNRKERPVIR